MDWSGAAGKPDRLQVKFVNLTLSIRQGSDAGSANRGHDGVYIICDRIINHDAMLRTISRSDLAAHYY